MFITSISHCVELVAQVALRRLDDAHSLKGSAAAGGGGAAAGGAGGGGGVGGGGGGEISNNERLSNELYTFFPVQENYFQRQDILISGSPGVCHESYFYVLVSHIRDCSHITSANI